MGKIDDMRRQREERHARDAAARADAAPKGEGEGDDDGARPPIARPAEVPARATPPSLGRRRPVADETGACSVCRKVRAVHGGLIASHQKGLGTVCPGSRKPPA